MLIVYVTLLLSVLSTSVQAEDLLTSSPSKSKRGIVEPVQNAAHDNTFYQPKSSSGYQSHQENEKLSPNYKSVELSPYNAGYNYNHGNIRPQYLYQQGPVETSVYTGHRAPTYPAQIHASDRYSLPNKGSLFTLPRDFKAVSEAATPSEQISTSQPFGAQYHQRVNSHSANQGSFNRNKLPLQQSPHAPGLATYSGIGQSQSQETYGGFPSLGLQVPVYKTSYSASGYAPSIQTSANAPASPAKLIQSSAYNQAVGSAAGNINGKNIPVLQVESGKQLAGYPRSFESQPLVLSSGLDHQGSLPRATGVQASAPFFGPVSGFQAQVVPIQTSHGSTQFPQYRGARVQAYPVITNPPKASPTYQALLAQPHLHFAGAPAAPLPKPVNTQPGLGSYGTPEKIRSDVEIINKEKPTPLPPGSDEDNDNDKGVDHGFDVFDKQYGDRDSQENKSEARGKPYSGLQVESDFKPSKSYPFEQYDDTFGKYSKSSSEENGKPSFKYTSQYSSSEEEDEHRSPSSKYSSSERSSYKSPYSRYEQEDQSEEETDKDGNQSSAEQKSEYSYGPKSYKHHPIKGYGQDSGESYKKSQKFRKYN